MIISLIGELSRRRRRAALDKSVVRELFDRWKVAYGFAVHGNYTMFLPLEEVRQRWDAADAAESKFVNVLGVLSSLIQSRMLLHIIEAEIVRLEKSRDRCRANSGVASSVDMYALERRLSEARALAVDIAALASEEP